MSEAPDRNLALELVRATEAAALAAARWVGRGQKNEGDGAAVGALRLLLGTVRMDGIVVIGEGEKDEAPMLYNGELVGNRQGPLVDVAVDPVEGTNLLAKGLAQFHLRRRHRPARLPLQSRPGFLHGQARRRPGGGRQG